MARKLSVEIVGDSRQLERAFSRSSRAAKNFNSDVGRMGRGGVAASGLFKSMGRSIAFASGAFLGGAGFVAATKNAITAASDLNEQMSKTNVVFGDSADAVVAWSKTSATAMGQSQRQALATASSFGALFRPLGLTGEQAAEQSKRLTQLGSDLASFYNTDVQSALDAIRSGVVGEAEPLRRYGVLLSETRVQQEALNETGKKNAKQLTAQEKAIARVALIFRDAKVATGDFQRTSGGLANQLRIAQANIDDLQTHIGQLLLPSITNAAKAFNAWISDSRNQQQVLDTLKQVIGAVTDVLKALQGVMKTLNSVTGSTKNSLKLLLGVFLAYKTARGVAGLASVAADIALIGTRAKAATGEVATLRGSLMSLSTLGPIGIAVAITVTAFTVQPFVTRALNKLFEGVGLRDKARPEGKPGPLGAPSKLVFRRGRLVWSGSGTPFQQGQTRDPVGRVAGGTRVTSQDPFATARGAFARLPDLAREPGGGPPKPRFTRAQLNQFFDAAIGRALSRASFQTLTQQLATYTAIAAKLRARIAVTKDVTRKMKLEDQLLAVMASRKEVRQQLAQKALDALQLNVDRAGLTKTVTDDLAALIKLRDALKRRIAVTKDNADLQSQLIGVEADIIAKREEAAQRRKEAQQKRQERLSTQLFSILGFGPGGAAKIPNIKQLRRQFAGLKDELATAPARLQRQAAAIAKVLERAFLPPDIRAKLREMLNGLTQELNRTGQGPVTKWAHQTTAQLVQGLGLNREQAVRLQQRLARRGPGGTVPMAGGGVGGAFGYAAAGGVVITGPVTVVANNPEEFVKAVDRKKRRGATSRTGPRAGTRGD